LKFHKLLWEATFGKQKLNGIREKNCLEAAGTTQSFNIERRAAPFKIQ
jgi:hypothetical protein